MAKSGVKLFEGLVKEMLEKHFNLRDNVGLLYVACVSQIRGFDYINTVTLYEHFKNETKDGNLKIPSISSVIRLNTKLQKEFVNLRGVDWEKKQKHSKDYKEDLGYGKI